MLCESADNTSYFLVLCFFFFFSSRRRHTICALVTGVQTCALPISGGSIRIAGEDVTSASPEATVRKGVATVPETRDVFPDLTVDENLTLGSYTHRGDRKSVV